MLELPFSIEQFLGVFRDYNNSIWPAQLIAYLLGILATLLANWNKTAFHKINSALLGAFWLWTGIFYHLIFFSEINKVAYLFGGLFIIQAVLFLVSGVAKDELQFHFRSNRYGAAGGVLIFYAMIIYPILNANLGHEYPYTPMFGVTPCPTTIFTFGMLLWSTRKMPLWLLIIPGLWSLIGFVAAIRLGMYEDFGLLLAGIIAIGMLFARHRKELAE